MIRKFAIFLFVFLLSSCVSNRGGSPIPVDYKYEAPVKIGYISMIAEKPSHRYIGIFHVGDFEHDLDVSWHLNEFVFDTMSAELKAKKGYQLVNLSAMKGAELFYNNDALVDHSGQFMKVNDAELMRLVNNIGYPDLDAIIIIRTTKLFYSKGLDFTDPKGQPGDHGFHSEAGGDTKLHSLIGVNMYSISPKPHYVGGSLLSTADKVSPQPANSQKFTPEELANYEIQFKNDLKANISEFMQKVP